MTGLADIGDEIQTRGRPADREIAALAARQHGVVARYQLVALGFGPGAIKHRLRAGRLYRVHTAVYAVGHPALSGRGRLMAAVLACGPDAVASHRAAAVLWEIRASAAVAVDVTTLRGAARSRPGIRVHGVRSLEPDDLAVRDAIPVTSLARTLLDLADVLRPAQLERAIEEAERLRLLDLRAVESLLERAPGRRRRRLAEALERAHPEAPATRSGLEREFLEFCRDADLPTPAVNAAVATFEVDAVWPDRRLVIELDSVAFHRTRRAFERDRVKDAALQVAGYRVLRVTDHRLRTQPVALERAIRALLGGGNASPA